MPQPPSLPSVAFLGLGLMGSRQALRIAVAGHPLTVWNRSPGKADAIVAAGGVVRHTPAEAVAGADVIFTMLTKGATVASVLFDGGAAAAMRPGAVVVDMSSITPAEARDHAGRLARRGIFHLDAPVSGGTVGAEEGTLAIMAGGPEAVFDKVAPLLALMGRAVRVGESGAGQVAKLANQMIVGITIGAVAEALAFAAKAGADPALVRTALRGGFAESRILDLHGERMVRRDFTPFGRTSIQIKDLDNALSTGAPAGAAQPFADLARTLFRDLLARHGDLDHSALILALEDRAAAEPMPDDPTGG
ncbi:NAD(P)-dependent oxidoreductase [Mongoliimonas terrestris]|uniref:NAD(P)-dependent oxidoreductase n=1 Tax=Mongoliimonas terrestris TaxID=1709001 RepID=UPI00094979DF|nr:NAD(P)-dependent oxidoreductase [Mongoliimonas terrestris]